MIRIFKDLGMLYNFGSFLDKIFATKVVYFTCVASKLKSYLNKSNSTVGAVRVEAGLPGTSAACAFFCIVNA